MFAGISATVCTDRIEVGLSCNDATYSLDFTVRHLRELSESDEGRSKLVADFVIETMQKYQHEHLWYVADIRRRAFDSIPLGLYVAVNSSERVLLIHYSKISVLNYPQDFGKSWTSCPLFSEWASIIRSTWRKRKELMSRQTPWRASVSCKSSTSITCCQTH